MLWPLIRTPSSDKGSQHILGEIKDNLSQSVQDYLHTTTLSKALTFHIVLQIGSETQERFLFEDYTNLITKPVFYHKIF